ncbi:MAG: hypothetical protein K2N48_07305 [Muribaculaceae bacterium]|nr:hypothetical protein [Muribaculaceae bacterium]
MKTIYIANDGKEFSDCCECEEYERELQYKDGEGRIFGLDGEEKKISFSGRNFCDDVLAVFLADEKAVEIFETRCEDEGINHDNIGKPGAYIWNEGDWDWRTGEWTPIDLLIGHYYDKIEELKEIVEKLKS